MSDKYDSKYNKFDSTEDFLNILKTANETTTNIIKQDDKTKSLNIDFQFSIKKFSFWFILFVIGYGIQPLIVNNLITQKPKYYKQGKNEDGSDWKPDNFTQNVITDATKTEQIKKQKQKLADEHNGEKDINGGDWQTIMGSRITILFTFSFFIFVFGNRSNTLDFSNKTKLSAMVLAWIIAAIMLEPFKTYFRIQKWSDWAERFLIHKMHNNQYTYIKWNDYTPSIKDSQFLIMVILGATIFGVPLIYSILKSFKSGVGLYTIGLLIVCLIIFVILPVWTKNRFTLSPVIRGLAIVTLILCRFNDIFSYIFAGLAIGVICSETHWMKSGDCKKVIGEAEKDATIADKDTTIAEKDTTIAEKDEQLNKITGELTQLTGINSNILNLKINNVQKGDVIKIQMKHGDNNITSLVETHNIPETHLDRATKDFLIDLTQQGSTNMHVGVYKAEITITSEGKDPRTKIIETASTIDPTTNLIDMPDDSYTDLKFYTHKIDRNQYTLEYTNTTATENLKVIVYDADQPFSSMANNHYYVNKPITEFDTIIGQRPDEKNNEKADATTNQKQLLINLFPENNPDLPLREPINIANVGVAICVTNNTKAYNKWIQVPTYIPNPDNDELIQGNLSHTPLLIKTNIPTSITVSNLAKPNQRTLKIDIAGVVNGQTLEYMLGSNVNFQGDLYVDWSTKYFINTINEIENVIGGKYSVEFDTTNYYENYGAYSSGKPSYLEGSADKPILENHPADEGTGGRITARVRVRDDTKIWSDYKQLEPYTLEVPKSTISGDAENDSVPKLKEGDINFIVCGSGADATNITEFVNNMILDGDKYREVNTTSDEEKRQSNVYRIIFTTKKKVGSHDNIIPNKMKIVVFDRDTKPELRMFNNYYNRVFETPTANLYDEQTTSPFPNVEDNMVEPNTAGHGGTKAPVNEDKSINDGLTATGSGDPVDGIRWEIWINIPDDKNDANLQTQISFAFNNKIDGIQYLNAGEINNWSDWIVFDQIMDHKKNNDGFTNIGIYKNMNYRISLCNKEKFTNLAPLTEGFTNLGSSTQFSGKYARF